MPELQRRRLGTATMRDHEPPGVPQETRAPPNEIQAPLRRYAEATVLELHRRVFPYHGL